MVLQAAVLCEEVLQLFSDEETSFLFLSAYAQADIPVGKADAYDAATPAGKAVMAQVLQSVGMLIERSEWTARGEEMSGRMLQTATRYTYSFGHWAALLQRELQKPKTLVVTGFEADVLHRQLLRAAPLHVLVLQAGIAAKNLPLTAGKKSDGDSLIFVCTGRACLPPVFTIQDALRLL